MTTKNRILNLIHQFLLKLLHIERRLEPWFSSAVEHSFSRTIRRAVQYLVNLRRQNEGLQLAEERIDPDEEESLKI